MARLCSFADIVFLLELLSFFFFTSGVTDGFCLFSCFGLIWGVILLYKTSFSNLLSPDVAQDTLYLFNRIKYDYSHQIEIILVTEIM